MNVYQAINAVQADLSQVGIAKTRRNTQGPVFNFRGIDDVLNALSPLLAKHGLVIVPRVISRQCTERSSKGGGALFYVTVEAEFDFVSAEDGSKTTARMIGEAMDSGDKATNKAMSAAYKYAAFQTFAIPTEGTPDADAETHEVAPTGMSAAVTREWLAAIDACQHQAELQTMVREGLEAAEDVKDREAYAAIRRAGNSRKAELTREVAA